MGNLPSSVTAAAFRTANGEYAWPRSHVISAIVAIGESHQAILGGEIWAVCGNQILGLLPSANKQEPPGVWHWETAARNPQESWDAYCLRTADESIATVKAMRVEEEVAPNIRTNIMFNITYTTEQEA
jgi:hypothetical protein